MALEVATCPQSNEWFDIMPDVLLSLSFSVCLCLLLTCCTCKPNESQLRSYVQTCNGHLHIYSCYVVVLSMAMSSHLNCGTVSGVIA